MNDLTREEFQIVLDQISEQKKVEVLKVYEFFKTLTDEEYQKTTFLFNKEDNMGLSSETEKSKLEINQEFEIRVLYNPNMNYNRTIIHEEEYNFVTRKKGFREETEIHLTRVCDEAKGFPKTPDTLEEEVEHLEKLRRLIGTELPKKQALIQQEREQKQEYLQQLETRINQYQK